MGGGVISFADIRYGITCGCILSGLFQGGMGGVLSPTLICLSPYPPDLASLNSDLPN